tara:strand:+ start:431 stop:1279 length:849 start_codon:yes stop_codon:yes gene_type:complete
MSADKQVKKYFENIPYGEDSLSSEIHGKKNQVIINKFTASLVRNYDEQMKLGDKEKAGHFSSAVKQMSQNLDNLKSIKEEFAMNYGGGAGGKNLFSHYTNLNFDRQFFTENGEIAFDENLGLKCIVRDEQGEETVKGIADITQDWVVKGTEEQQYMKMQQNAQKQSNSVGQPLDFDVDFTIDNLLAENDAWKVMVSDKIGGRYFLHDYLQENQDKIQSGEITDEMLHPDSFNPDFDTRLHQYYASRIKKSFDPNHQTAKERAAAEGLIAKSSSKNNTENNQA